jgi:hypothetical protein
VLKYRYAELSDGYCAEGNTVESTSCKHPQIPMFAVNSAAEMPHVFDVHAGQPGLDDSMRRNNEIQSAVQVYSVSYPMHAHAKTKSNYHLQ